MARVAINGLGRIGRAILKLAVVIGRGGEQRAVFVYQIDCYRYWQRELGRYGFSFGQFGENFTVEGLPDDEVCIGDRYRIGSAPIHPEIGGAHHGVGRPTKKNE